MKLLGKHLASIAISASLLFGCGQEYDFEIPESSDNFASSIVRNNKVDVVFIVDDSETMANPQKQLKESIPGMVAALLKLKMDLHIAVISTSMGPSARGGRFLGSPRFLTSGTPDLGGHLATHLQMGVDGRAREAGLQSLLTVLSPSYLEGEGQGFLREDALLAIMAITNEDDHSGIAPIGQNDVTYTANFLSKLKKPFDNGEKSWTVNLIGVTDTTARCQTNPEWNYTEMSQKYIDLANMSKGIVESICADNLTRAVGNIKSRIVQVLTDYKLTREPDVSTIRVYSNGTLVPRSNVNGWEYLPEQRIVRLYGSWIPASDVSFRVDFAPAHAD